MSAICYEDMEETVKPAVMLKELFLQVDALRSGQVHSKALVSTLSHLVAGNPNVDRWKVEELSALLDPKSDNVLVTKEHFIEVGLAWIQSITGPLEPNMTEAVSTFSLMQAKCPDGSSKEWSLKLKPTLDGNESMGFHNSSLGLLDMSAMNVTFGSFNGTGTFGDFDLPATEEHTGTEVDDELKNFKKRLTEEKSTLETQLYSAEETANQVQSENDQLRDEVRNLKRQLASAKLTVKELSELKNGFSTSTSGAGDAALIATNNVHSSPIDGLKEEAEKNVKLSMELTKAKCREREALEMADELKLRITQLEEAMQNDRGEAVQCMMKEQEEVAELKRVKAKLQEDVRRLQTDVAVMLDVQQPVRGISEADISFDNVLVCGSADDSFANNGMWAKLSSGRNDPKILSTQSTPCLFSRTRKCFPSIEDEFKRMGLSSDGIQKRSTCSPSGPSNATEDLGGNVEGKEGSGMELLDWFRKTTGRFASTCFEYCEVLLKDNNLYWRNIPSFMISQRAKKCLIIVLILSATFIFFTFFCALNIGDTVYRPYTWMPTLGPFELPQPFEILKFRRLSMVVH